MGSGLELDQGRINGITVRTRYGLSCIGLGPILDPAIGPNKFKGLATCTRPLHPTRSLALTVALTLKSDFGLVHLILASRAFSQNPMLPGSIPRDFRFSKLDI